MRSTQLLLTGLVLALACGALADGVITLATLNLYVAPDGDDAWSGLLNKPNAARTDGPLATLVGARNRVRELRGEGRLVGPVRIMLRNGTYRLTEPLLLEPVDSGSAQCPITYTAYPGETPIISGGRVISGWRVGGDGAWVVDVPWARRSGRVFRELFVNGQRRTLARSPNEGYYRVAGKAAPVTEPETGNEVDTSKTAFRFAPGDIRDWGHLGDINVVVYYHWETAMLRIARVDEAESTVYFTGESKWPFTQQGGHQRYFVENSREFLDAPGEWFLDRRLGRLYYCPLPGERPDTTEVVAPVTDQLVLLAGRPDEGRFVEHVSFEGLQLEYGGYTLEPEGHGDWQAACTVPAVIHANGARHCEIRNCRIAHIGLYGIWFERGCKANRVEGSEITDMGAGGVRLGQGGPPATPDTETDHNVVTSNFIHDGGKVYPGAVGIWVGHASDNQITHNEVCDLNYTGISCGWSWGYGQTKHHRNEIGYNHIHHIGRGVLSDMGAIYTLGISPGTRVHHNLIHDIWCFPEGYGAGGIYPDEGSSEITIENNVVHDTISGGLTLHYGKDNVVRNNIFAFGRDQQVVRGRNEEHMAFTFERNIVYFDCGQVWAAGGPNRNWKADWNVYWDVRKKPLEFLGSLSLEAWRSEGFDLHSLVADPLFVNAARRNFRLRPESPALKLGFEPIDMGPVGLIGPPELVALARSIKRPPVVLPARPEQKPVIVDDGFEHGAVGTTAEGATTWGQTEQATIRISDEAAASGKHSLKFTDAPGLDQPWNPHLWYNPYHREGVTRLRFDLRFEPGTDLAVEWRDWSGQPYRVGPSLAIGPQGKLVANGKELMTLPANQWVHFDTRCGVGKLATGKYSLTVTVPGAPAQTFEDLPCDPRMKELTWIGFISNATERAVFYLDNVKLESLKR